MLGAYRGTTVEWSESINFIPLVSSLAGLLESIEPLFNKLMESFEWFWDEIVLPLSSFVIEDGLPAFFDLLSAALDLFNGVCETTRPVAEWLWDNLLGPIASWTGGTIVEVMGWLTEALQELSAWFDEKVRLSLKPSSDLENRFLAFGLSLYNQFWSW